MKPPAHMVYATLTTTVRGYGRQAWRDLKSVYYANTPIWRWLKSGALLFLGFGLWAASTVLYSVTGWWPLLFVMAYGFLLIFWGPFTHMVVVPLTIRLRRAGKSKPARVFSRNSGKINLTVFFICVVALATLAPGLMMLEFSPTLPGDSGPDASGELVCDPGEEVVFCEIIGADGFDHVVVTSGGETLVTVEEPPFEFELQRDELHETRTGLQFEVEFRDEDGNTLQRLVERA